MTVNHLKRVLESRGLPVDGAKATLVDRYTAVVINDAGTTASDISAAAEPIQSKVSHLSMTALEHESHYVPYKAVTAWLFHKVNTCRCCAGAFKGSFQSCAMLVAVLHGFRICAYDNKTVVHSVSSAWHMLLQSCPKVHFADHTLMC